MLVYLVRHGKAKDESEDPERGLTDLGREEVRKAGVFLSTKNIRVERILHSPKKRARETADILAGCLNPAGGASEEDGLLPLDEPGVWQGRLIDSKGDVMLVGHLPHLERLASLLAAGDSEKYSVTFAPSEVVCMKRTDGGFSLMWKAGPGLL